MAEAISTQYQHFVPQFLIKNFSHPFKPQNNVRKKSHRSKRKPIDGMYPNDPVVHNLNLLVDPPVLCEAPVKRIFGKMDMYRDTSKPSAEQQYIEQMFSKLECQASIVFRKITKSFEEKEKGLWLTHDERNLVRKFLFILKYRGSGFHQRFYHESAESYDSNDRQLLCDYMKERGYKRPMDVWLDNLKTIMELHMDPKGEWIMDLPKRMFFADAMWFITHAQSMYMAICTTSDPSDEFILTENSYNVFEGPNCFVVDQDTGKVEGAEYTPLHEFAPISPKLMIILRSLVLPVPEEDASQVVKEERRAFHSMVLDMVYKEEVKSRLADLPIKKARNNYTMIVNGRVELNSSEERMRSKNDKFCFEYFPISTEHVQTINGIFLDNAYAGSRVVFKTKDSFSRTLESYLSTQCTSGKLVMGDNADLRLALLKKLAAVSRSLGSDKESVWREESTPIVKDYEKFLRGKIEEQRNPDKGSEKNLFVDVAQAALMWKLRVTIDVWSQGLDETLRERNRILLIESYLRLPPCRVWLYLKQFRLAFFERVEKLKMESGNFDGATSCIIRADKLAQLMYKAAKTDIEIKGPPEAPLWAYINNFSQDEVERIALIARNLFSPIQPRYIRDCGIKEIEELARKQQLKVLRSGQQYREALGYSMFDDSEKIELLTRVGVRLQFVDALSGKLEPSLLEALKDVFFELLYPTLT